MGEKIDAYPAPVSWRIVETSADEINAILGITVPKEEQERILRLLDIVVDDNGDKWKLTIPARRMDLEIKENIAEEVGRIYGYDQIPPALLDAKFERQTVSTAEKKYRLANKLREILINKGFSEVYGYTFAERGEIELANPLALDKPHLRSNLRHWLKTKLQFNLQHVLFDNEAVKIFELGHIFNLQGGEIIEESSLCLGIGLKGVKQKMQEGTRTEMAAIKQELIEQLGIKNLPEGDSSFAKAMEGEEESEADNVNNLSSTVWEASFDRLAEQMDVITEEADLSVFISPAKEYKKISSFPRIVRDIALWVPENVTEDEVANTIRESAGPLLTVGPVLFDRFPKDGRLSLAFRQVFQSYEKTLSDDEVNKIMEQITAVLEDKGWEVRK